MAVVGQIIIFPIQFVPRGFIPCSGQTLKTADYPALFSAIGTTYGGDGDTTFALPDMRGRVALHHNHDDNMHLGKAGGAETVQLETAQIPAHRHSIASNSAQAQEANPTSHIPAASASGQEIYAEDSSPAQRSGALKQTDGGQPHTNMQPYVAMHFAIFVG